MEFLYNAYKGCSQQTVISRQLTKTFVDIEKHEKEVKLNKIRIKIPEAVFCYPCGNKIGRPHPVYIFSCNKCGNISQRERHATRDLSGHVAVVTGGRIKLGHQIVMKLIRAGADVVLTTRDADGARDIFSTYPDYEKFSKRLWMFQLDLDTKNISEDVAKLAEWVGSKWDKVDIVVNSAAQTIRCKEKNKDPSPLETNRYAESKYVASDLVNSWQMELKDIEQSEMEEVFRVNAMGPCLLIQGLYGLLEKSAEPYIINVNSREGLFEVSRKSKYHIHLNIVKAGLSQMHRTMCDAGYKNLGGKRFRFHLCDPGWISVDEYYKDSSPWIVPPLDEIDGAARILYPLMKSLNSQRRTRRHFNYLSY